MNDKVYIYGLYEDYDQGNIRYIGKTCSPEQRLREHLADTTNTHKAHWVQSCLANKVRIGMVVLQILDNPTDEEWQAAERLHIDALRNAGAKLTNSTDGGEGVSGHRHSDATKEYLSFIKQGSKCVNSKLTEQGVGEIRVLFAQGFSKRELAHNYGVTVMTLNDVLRGRTWKHVGGPLIPEGKSGWPRKGRRAVLSSVALSKAAELL